MQRAALDKMGSDLPFAASSTKVGSGLDAVIRLFFSDDRFVALSSRSQPEIRSFDSKQLLSPAPDFRCTLQ